MARAPRGARSSASGHSSARLCAEEPEAGIQARGVRTVRGDARCGEAGSHADRDERADPVARAARGGSRADRGAGRPARQRRVPARRFRGGDGGRRGGRGCDGRDGWPRDEPQRPGGRSAASRPQRSVPVRQRQEVQALSRQAELT
nr:hypothetical protein [Burkholderia pseudomallei]